MPNSFIGLGEDPFLTPLNPVFEREQSAPSQERDPLISDGAPSTSYFPAARLPRGIRQDTTDLAEDEPDDQPGPSTQRPESTGAITSRSGGSSIVDTPAAMRPDPNVLYPPNITLQGTRGEATEGVDQREYNPELRERRSTGDLRRWPAVR